MLAESGTSKLFNSCYRVCSGIPPSLTPAAGSTIVIFGSNGAVNVETGTPSCADAVNGSYGSYLGRQTEGLPVNQATMAFAKVNVANSAITPTITWGSNVSYRAIAAVEVAGVPVTSSVIGFAIGQAVSPGTGTDAITSGAIDLTILGGAGAKDGIIIAFCNDMAQGVAANHGTGFTDQNASIWTTNGYNVDFEKKNFTGQTSVTATFTAPSNGTDTWEWCVIVLGQNTMSPSWQQVIGFYVCIGGVWQNQVP